MTRKILIVIGLLVSYYTVAHQDTIINLASDGNLIGLPKEYLPASFERSSWTVSIADKKFVFPACISTQLADLEISEFDIKSSWYNPIIIISDTENLSLPSYLNITVESENFSVLLKLDTARPFNPYHPEYTDLTTDEICDLRPSPNKNLIIDSAKNASQNK